MPTSLACAFSTQESSLSFSTVLNFPLMILTLFFIVFIVFNSLEFIAFTTFQQQNNTSTVVKLLSVFFA